MRPLGVQFEQASAFAFADQCTTVLKALAGEDMARCIVAKDLVSLRIELQHPFSG